MRRNLTPEVIVMKIFILLRRGTPVLFPRDFVACEQPLLEIKNLRESDMNFYVMKISSDLNCI